MKNIDLIFFFSLLRRGDPSIRVPPSNAPLLLGGSGSVRAGRRGGAGPGTGG